MQYRSIALLLLAVVETRAQVEAPISEPDQDAACFVCYDGSTPLSEPVSNGLSYTTDITCSSIISDVAASTLVNADEECQTYQLLGYQLGCCAYPPYTTCDICPDGSDYERLNTLPTGQEVGTDPSCAEYELRAVSYVGIFEPGVCSDTYVGRIAHYCGCPTVTQECYLCSDGQEPTNPERGDNFFLKARCEAAEFLFSLYSEDECSGAREGWGIDYEHFCKCPDYVKPEDDGQCNLCSGGLKNPDYVFTNETDTFERTCQQAQDFADSITSENSCLRFMSPILERGCLCNSGETEFLAAGETTSGASLSSFGLSSLLFVSTTMLVGALSLFHE